MKNKSTLFDNIFFFKESIIGLYTIYCGFQFKKTKPFIERFPKENI